jgi:hypothetical protein
MTLEELRAQHPELVSALITEGKALGITEGRAAGIEEGKSLGATAERERIQAVLNCSIKGHEDLIKKLAFDGKTTSGEAALQVLAAEQAARDRTRKALETEAPDPAAASASSEQREAEQRAEEAKEGEPKWRAEFEKSEDLKAEFQTVERYLAFKNAEASGKARILRK